MARWYYTPSSDSWSEEERYFCDNCIKRGCSCNLVFYEESDPLYFSGEEERDEQGRLFPCCEYDYSISGFEDYWLDCEDFEGN